MKIRPPRPESDHFVPRIVNAAWIPNLLFLFGTSPSSCFYSFMCIYCIYIFIYIHTVTATSQLMALATPLTPISFSFPFYSILFNFFWTSFRTTTMRRIINSKNVHSNSLAAFFRRERTALCSCCCSISWWNYLVILNRSLFMNKFRCRFIQMIGDRMNNNWINSEIVNILLRLYQTIVINSKWPPSCIMDAST